MTCPPEELLCILTCLLRNEVLLSVYVYPEKVTYNDRLTARYLGQVWGIRNGGGEILSRDNETGHPVSVEREIT